MNMASTPPAPTMGTATCSWTASPCIIMKPQVRGGAEDQPISYSWGLSFFTEPPNSFEWIYPFPLNLPMFNLSPWGSKTSSAVT